VKDETEPKMIDLMENPFADTAEISIGDVDIRGSAPSMPDTKVQDLLKAQRNERFDKQEGINERFLLNKEYMSVASQISAELGPFTLSAFEDAQPIVEAAALRVLNEGDNTGSFRGQNASGSSQFDISGLTTSTFGGDQADRVYDVTAGDNRIVDYTVDSDAQSVFVMGYFQSTNPRVIEQVQIDVDDGETRTATEVYSHTNLGTLQAMNTPSVEYLEENDTATIDVRATQAASTDFFPFGIDFNSAANLPSLDGSGNTVSTAN